MADDSAPPLNSMLERARQRKLTCIDIPVAALSELGAFAEEIGYHLKDHKQAFYFCIAVLGATMIDILGGIIYDTT